MNKQILKKDKNIIIQIQLSISSEWYHTYYEIKNY